MITDNQIKDIEKKALAIRRTIIEMLAEAKSGHTAGPLGMADIFAALYFHVLKHDPKNPDWAERDRLMLSHGHITPVRYAAMAHAGYFPLSECLTLRKFGSRLQGHPEREKLPGVETTSGPLGSGLSQASGYAYAARMDGKTFRVFCLMSDGEQEEGNTWEGAMFAGKYRLTNLTAVLDRNNIQIDGNTEDVIEVDGHNISEFVGACDEAKSIKEKPTLILAHTTPGKGIPSIENDYRWHGNPPGKGPTDKVPADKQKETFLKELEETQI